MLEGYALILGPIAATIGIITCFGFFTQTMKIIKRKSCADVSLTTYILSFFCGSAWLLYGISINNINLIIPNVIAIVGVISVLLAFFAYKK